MKRKKKMKRNCIKRRNGIWKFKNEDRRRCKTQQNYQNHNNTNKKWQLETLDYLDKSRVVQLYIYIYIYKTTWNTSAMQDVYLWINTALPFAGAAACTPCGAGSYYGSTGACQYIHTYIHTYIHIYIYIYIRPESVIPRPPTTAVKSIRQIAG